MKIFILSLLCVVLSGCAFSSHTMVSTQGKDITAYIGATPIKGDLDVIVERRMAFTIWGKPIPMKDVIDEE